MGKSRQEERHARDVAIIFPGLICAPQNHIIDVLRVETSLPIEEAADDQRCQIIRAHPSKRATMVANRGTDAINDECHKIL